MTSGHNWLQGFIRKNKRNINKHNKVKKESNNIYNKIQRNK